MTWSFKAQSTDKTKLHDRINNDKNLPSVLKSTVNTLVDQFNPVNGNSITIETYGTIDKGLGDCTISIKTTLTDY